MPDFTIPPWLEPQRFAPLFAQGAQTGVAAAAQRNEAAQVAAKLAAQSAIEAAQLKLAQEVAMQKAAQSALELELEKQRNSAMLSFREKEAMDQMSARAAQLQLGYDRLGLAEDRFLQDKIARQEGPVLHPVDISGKRMYLTPNGAVVDVNKLDPVTQSQMRLKENVVKSYESDPTLKQMYPEAYQRALQEYQDFMALINRAGNQNASPTLRFIRDANGALIRAP